MTPAARLAAAIDILDAILAGEPAERALTRWARASRFAGAKDRAAIRDIVFDCLRRRRSLGWRGGGDGGRALVLGLLAAEGVDPGTLFTGEGHAPAPLAPEERAALARDPAGAPRAVRLDIPDFLEAELAGDLGAAFEPVMQAMQSRAPVDLRANLIRCDRATAAAALAAEGIRTEPHALAPTALRVIEGARLLARSRAYRQGFVELQDVSSQVVAAEAGARPGMSVLDFCAGGGGKSLALAAAMGGRGRIFCHDAKPGRMKDLPHRARRAGIAVTIVPPEARDALPPCELVFVDAPCSGTGAWRRNPEAKWRLSPDDLGRLAALQDAILDQAAQHLRPGGRLVYATCSLLARENEARAAAFLARHPGWTPEGSRRLGPLEGGDGFFVARFRAPS
jgi:16S rRNA (cytosine967-C5)-methyltransferase